MSVTLMVTVKVPAAVGVPEITPAVLIVIPDGNVPAVVLHEYGETPP